MRRLAIADLERDVEQDVRRAVVAVEIVHAELHTGSSLAVARIVHEALAEIDCADLRVATDLFGRAFRDQAAAIEHQDAVGVFEHHNPCRAR